MNDPRWFRLMVRGIGILTLALALPRVGDIARLLGTLAQGPSAWTMYTPYITTGSGGTSWWNPYVFSLLVAMLADLSQIALGAYLLFGAPRLVQFCIRQVGGRCPACDYDIRGLKGACPECGVPITAQPAPPQS
jgi:hypothetical protein